MQVWKEVVVFGKSDHLLIVRFMIYFAKNFITFGQLGPSEMA
jgi:hypothetical protein